MATKLDLSEFRTFNLARSLAPKDQGGYGHALDQWSPAEWGCALAGEAGEFCNLLKKLRRGEDVDRLMLADEACDVLCYLDLATARLNLDLAKAVVRKWDSTSLTRNYPILLATHRSYR